MLDRTPKARPERPKFISAVTLAFALSLFLPSLSAADYGQVFLDGYFEEWGSLPVTWTDGAGDGGPNGVDFVNLWVTEDDDFLYICFETTGDLILQEDNQLTLYIDNDLNTATGYPIPNMGADIVWEFGDRIGFLFYDSTYDNIDWVPLRLAVGPTHSGNQFELCLLKTAVTSGHPFFPQDDINIQIRDASGGGDWIPDMNTVIPYTLNQGSLDPLETIELTRAAGPIRMITYNVYQDRLWNYYAEPSYERILQALDPDVIAFQEIYDHNATETRQQIEGWLGTGWDASQVSDKVFLTRGDIIGQWSIAGGRAGAFLSTPVGDFDHDFLVIDCHLSCCGADEDRQMQCDAIMEFIRDARTAGGQLDLTADNPIIITGDMNFVGLRAQLVTLLTGDIEDEATYGPDFAPDWDDTDFIDLQSRQCTNGLGYTWYKEWSDYGPGRLDFIIYSDSNIQMPVHGILQTEYAPQAFLNDYGLQRGDSEEASDHLPHFADFSAAEQGIADVWPAGQGEMRLSLAGSSLITGPVEVHLEWAWDAAAGGLPTWPSAGLRVSVHDVAGRLLARLHPVAQTDTGFALQWDRQDAGGRPAEPGVYWIRAAGGGQVATTRALIVR